MKKQHAKISNKNNFFFIEDITLEEEQNKHRGTYL